MGIGWKKTISQERPPTEPWFPLRSECPAWEGAQGRLPLHHSLPLPFIYTKHQGPTLFSPPTSSCSPSILPDPFAVSLGAPGVTDNPGGVYNRKAEMSPACSPSESESALEHSH